MANFKGVVGYAQSTETKPGVFDEVIVERTYRGDILKNNRQLTDGEGVNPNVTLSNSISIVADPYAREHFFAIRFVEWAGVLWTVANTEVQSPRLLLRLGGVYNGRRAIPPVDPDGEGETPDTP